MTKPDTVVLIHGLYMHGVFLTVLARRLSHWGYEPVTFSYPTMRRSSQDNARALGKVVRSRGEGRVHLVAHSLGGLVVRHLLALEEELPRGRVVTLGTPHQGSHTARFLHARGLDFVCGLSLREALLGDAPAWEGRRELGSLAGTRNIGMGRALADVPPPADGMVAVAETRLAGMTDHICLPVTHTGMIYSMPVAVQVRTFLESGRFDHDTL